MNLGTNTKKRAISLVLGILLFAFGIIPLVKQYSSYFSNIPDALFNPIVLEVLIAVGGIFLLYDSFNIGHGRTKFLAVLLGLLLALLGLVPILIQFELLGFLPFIAALKINKITMELILIFYGAYLVVDVFVMNRYAQEVVNVQ